MMRPRDPSLLLIVVLVVIACLCWPLWVLVTVP
jgi:hypothetical protein